MSQYEMLIRLSHNCPYTALSSKLPAVSINHWCSNERDVLEIRRTAHDSREEVDREIGNLVRSLKARIMRRQARDDYNQIVVYKHIAATMSENVNAVIERCNCVEMPPTTYHSGAEWYRVVSFSNVDANALIKVLSTFAQVSVERFSVKPFASIRESFMISTSSLFGDMTPNQLSALKVAILGGYFDLPARVDTKTLAKARRVARTTYEVHLRKSMKKLLDSIMPYVEMETGRTQ